jgi:hypothetical protein
MSPFFVSGSIELSIVDGREDGEPLAETNVHLMAIVAITAVLKQLSAQCDRDVAL